MVSTTASDTYPLGRNPTESQRLNLQHEIWIKNIGYYVNPSIPSLGPTARVADIGTGSGVYLTELAKQLPSTCRLDGFDISAIQFPLPPLPQNDTDGETESNTRAATNITFHTHDAKNPYPAALHGQFDLVHLRLMVTALEESDWATVTQHAVQLLKPGGAIQWAEPDTLGSALVRGRQYMHPTGLIDFAAYFHAGMSARLRNGFSNLPSVFAAEGLERISQDVVASDNDPTTRSVFTALSYSAMFGWASHVHRMGVPGAWGPDQLQELRAKIDKEIEAGAYCRFNIYVTLGFKKGAVENQSVV